MRWQEFESGIEFKNLSVFQQSDAKRFRELELASNSIGCIKEKGIANKHAYPVHDLVEFNKSGKLVRLVKIQKTAGAEGEWSGDWSRNSELWTADLKAKYLDLLGENEFFVTYEIYKSWFKGTLVNLDQNSKKYFIN